MSVQPGNRPASGGFVHAALIVESDDSLRSSLVPLLRRSLTDGQPVLMVVGKHTARVVRDELGELADQFEWGEPAAYDQRLGFTFETFRRYLAAQHEAGRRVHVVAEPDVATEIEIPGAVDRVAAYLPYEAMCNEAYAEYDCPVTCIWDSRRHPTLVIQGVRSLHDHEVTAAGKVVNRGYIPPEDYLAGRSEIPPEPPPPVVDLDLHATDLDQIGPVRRAVRRWAEDQQFVGPAVDDVVLAVTEVATNGLVHGAPPVRVRAWRHADTLVVQVDDDGGRPIPPTAGYRPPATPRGGDAHGLWLARQVTDVLIAHTAAGVTSVRLHFPYEVTHRDVAR